MIPAQDAPVPEPVGAPLRLHHIGYAVPEIEPAARSFCLRFGYRPVSGITHDPLQTALIQFLRLPGDALYLELVAPDSPASKLSAAARRGGELHHLCYTCASLGPAVAALEATGMRLIVDARPAAALDGRSICWLLGADRGPVELIERRYAGDLCEPPA